jgi:phosphomannomutase
MLHNFRAQWSNDHLARLVEVVRLYAAWPGVSEQIAISHDSRYVSRLAAEHIIEALKNTRTVWLGLATTPVASNFGMQSDVDVVHVTASHLPPDFVGLKLMRRGMAIRVAEEKRLRSQTYVDRPARLLAKGSPVQTGKCSSSDISLDAWQIYSNRLRIKLGSCIRTAAVEVRAEWVGIFEKFFPELSIISRESTDVAREQSPPACSESNEIILRLDEDADQLVVWRGNSRIAGSELLFNWLIHNPTDRVGPVVVSYDIPLTVTRAPALRGRPIAFTPVGDQYITHSLRECGVAIGGEPNGHLIDATWLPGPDGLACGLTLLNKVDEWQNPGGEVMRIAFSLSQIERERLKSSLLASAFTLRHGMWEWVKNDRRCLVRFSSYEDSLIVQAENFMSLAQIPLPAWVKNSPSDILDLQLQARGYRVQ